MNDIRRAVIAGLCASIALGCSSSGSTDDGPLDAGADDASSGDGANGDAVTDSGGFKVDVGNESGGCKAKTCKDVGANCGPVADGCGGLLDCGKCTAPLTCGGGGAANVCGSKCVPQTCATLKVDCGKQGDGCGGVLECGICVSPQVCGGGGPSKCGVIAGGDAGACAAKTCADLGANCGFVSDGCGGLLSCGSCAAPAICGGGGAPNVCGGVSPCTPKTCASAGASCGPIGDGCGGVVASCGTCTAPDVCGGGGTPSVCGGATASPACVNLACKQVACGAGATTSISGTVHDPAGLRPLPNVFVYVPNAAVGAFTSGASCDKCSAALMGAPLVTTTTDVNGNFTLPNMPVDTNVPVVIQIGKWRRQITVTTAKCANTAVDASLTRLPKNKAEGDIPKIALTTGDADPLECLLRKIGIDDAEFTNPDGAGRVNLFSGYKPSSPLVPPPTSSYSAALGGASFPDAEQLWDSVDPTASVAYGLRAYDVVLMGCEGTATTANKPAGALSAMQSYVDGGGRVFGEHYHYVWMLDGPSPWPGLVTWNPTLDKLTNPTQETVLTGFPKGATMNQWMQVVGAASAATPSLFPVNEARRSIVSINDATNVVQWIQAPTAKSATYKPPPTYTNLTQYLSFNTPVGAAADSVCGRFVFSDIHVASGDLVGAPFPSGCSTKTLTPQELALEFMFFDLASRVCDETVPPPPPTCTPATCGSLGISCGPVADGCGALLDCGPCTAPESCGGGGVAGKCGAPGCTPTTCTAQGISCGSAGDGCGGLLDCGPCTAPETCGGGGVPGKCGVSDGGSCVPQTCGTRCGPQGDGCGGVLSCPSCDGGSCTPTTCAAFGAACGIIGDGCGGTLDCGPCAAPQTCGGGGTPYQCGGVK